MMSKFSIILPVRTGWEYIKECITSILSQTFQDFNLLVLENFSTDGTVEWIESLNDARIKIIPAETPLSMDENWGRIKDIPKNEFMTMIGYDDVLYPNYLEVISGLIMKYPHASLFQTHFHFIDSNGKIIRNCKLVKEVETVSQFLESICFNRTSIIGTGFMMRSFDYDSIGGIPMYPNLLFADFELWLELTRIKYKATAPETTFSYRVHSASTTSSSPFGKYVEGFDRLMKYFKKLTNTDPSVASFITANWIQFISYYCKGSAHKLLRTPINKRDGMNVKTVLNKYIGYANEFAPGKEYFPARKFSIWLALVIDSNIVTRNIYFIFKKIYPQPIYR